ncbi:uncharacterized protein [Triticum aestivum]|uniref:uncharacterized protein n=1 Tax=Triticum aestivum TaxID=4565 RepID=UPI001D00E9CA|nr:uncharacterized protein LOC123138863 [Triticum aestivum]
MAFDDLFGEPPSPATHSSSSSSSVHSGTSPLPSTTLAPLSTTAATNFPLNAAPSSSQPPLTNNNDHISSYIKFKLDSAGKNFSKCRTFFRIVLSQYRVEDHVDRPPPANADAPWLAIDHRMALWILFTLADPLLELITDGAVTAYMAWHRISDYFLANHGAQIRHLTRRYRNLQQGDHPIVEYACRLKSLADNLADVGAAVTDYDLTMQLLHGLAPRFETIHIMLGSTNRLPPFGVVRSRLELADYNLFLHAATEGASTLSITNSGFSGSGGSGGSGDRGDRAPPGAPTGRGTSGARGNDSDRGRGRGRGGSGRGRGRPDSGGRDSQ